MGIGIYSFASSSSGNSYLIQSEKTNLLVDVGISMKKMDEHLTRAGISYEAIQAVMVTHDHSDHIKGLKTLVERRPFRNSIYTTRGTRELLRCKYESLQDESFEIIKGGDSFQIGDIQVETFCISHDAREPVGFSFRQGERKVSIVTDTGCVTEEIFQAISCSDVLIIEANHEKNFLLYGKYPYHLKQRILSDYGHLSNETTGKILCRFLKDLQERGIKKIPQVVLAHLSEENNSPLQARLTIENCLEEENFYVGKDLRLEIASKEGDGRLLAI